MYVSQRATKATERYVINYICHNCGTMQQAHFAKGEPAADILDEICVNCSCRKIHKAL
jgi:hypothetical protein